MTGRMDMASLSQWKPSVTENNRIVSDLLNKNSDPHTNTSFKDIHGISSWKRELMSKQNATNDEYTSNCVPEINVNHCEENGNDNVFVEKSFDNVTLKTKRMGTGTREIKDGPTPRKSSDNDIEERGSVVTSHLRHVHSNPFFKDYGMTHPHGKIFDSDASSDPNSPTFSVGNDDNDMDRASKESGPFSGIVGKRRKLFLQTQSVDNFKPVRRFASLENLLDSKKVKTISSSSMSPVEKSSGRLFSDSGSKEKSKSIEKVNVHKPIIQHQHIQKPPRLHKPPVTRSNDNVSDHNKPSIRQEHHLAADIEIGRDDIIIIEQTKPPKLERVESKENEFSLSNSLKALKDEKQNDELPKQNTVSSVLSKFESAAGLRKRLKDIPRSPTFKPPLKPKTVLPSNNNKTSDTQTVKSSLLTDVDRKSLPSNSELSVTENVSLPSSTIANKVDTPSPKLNDVDTDVSLNTGSSVKSRFVASKLKEEGMFDSPLTKKRDVNEKKSIFDSKVIVPKESPKVQPKFKKETNKKDDEEKKLSNFPEKKTEDIIETKQKSVSEIVAARNLSQTSSSLINREISRKVEKLDNIGKNGNKSSMKSEDSINLNEPSSEKIREVEKTIVKDDKKPASSEIFPARKEIFDSNMIVPVKENSSDEIKKSKPPRPKTKLVKKNSSEGKPEINTDVKVERNNIINERKREHNLNKSSSNKSVKNQEIDNKEGMENGLPTKGVPSIMLDRYKKDNMKVAGHTELYKPESKVDNNESDLELVKPSLLHTNRFHAGAISSPVPKKRQAPKPPTSSNETVLEQNKNNAAVSVKLKPTPGRSNIDDLIGGNRRRASPSAVFDSSNIVSAAPVVNGNLEPLTRLDLSSLTNEPVLDHPYQEGYIPTKILPCNIKFSGAEIKFQQNPLKKTRSNQQFKITFDDNAKTHEYVSEDQALKEYLVDNPHELAEAQKDRESRDEALLKLEDFGLGDQESSDDVVIPETPREEKTMKSNTSIGHASGELVNYKSKMQVDFEFGMAMQEPEPAKEPEVVPQPDPDDMELRPADEEDLANWSQSSTSDLLF